MSRVLAGPHATLTEPPRPLGAAQFLALLRALIHRKNPVQSRAAPRRSHLQELEEERETEGNRPGEGAVLFRVARW